MKIFIFGLFLLPLIVSAQEIALRSAKQDGVNTYRIPGISTSKKGVLLAVWDNRNLVSSDLQGDIDIGMCRSFDGGKSWLPLQVILDMGCWGDFPQKFNGVSDGSVLVDRHSGRIWVSGLWMHGVLDSEGKWIEGLKDDSKVWQHQWRDRGSQCGFSPYETSQFLLTYSDDDGATWSKPINITQTTKRKEWWLFAPAPGNGITLTDGTLVFPSQGRDSVGVPFSNITYSKDRGKTWLTSNPVSTNTTECAVVQLSDGSLMLNMRDNRNAIDTSDTNGRAVFLTDDLGQTWREHPSSHNSLIESVCMGSLYKHYYAKNKFILLFCNPATKTGRHNMRLKYSLDEGNTWSEGFLLDEGESFGYSSITSIDKNTIGVLWEGSRAHMSFRSVRLHELGLDAL